MTFKLMASSPVSTDTPNSETRLVRELQWLRDSDLSDTQRRGFARGHLKAATSSAIRNAAALALSDLEAVDAVPAIVELLLEPGMAADGGTLLYAIEELRGDLPLGVFVHVLANGSYEARQQALDLLVAGHVVDDEPAAFDGRLSQIEAILRDENREKAEAAQEALAILREPAEEDSAARREG